MRPVTLRKPLLLATGEQLANCPACNSEDTMESIGFSHKRDYVCNKCGMKALDASVFRIKGKEDL